MRMKAFVLRLCAAIAVSAVSSRSVAVGVVMSRATWSVRRSGGRARPALASNDWPEYLRAWQPAVHLRISPIQRVFGPMTRFASILETVGNTPVVRINKLAPAGVELYVKIEAF